MRTKELISGLPACRWYDAEWIGTYTGAARDRQFQLGMQVAVSLMGLFVIVVLAAIGAVVSMLIGELPQVLVHLLRRFVQSDIKPSFSCVAVVAWLIFAAGIALLFVTLFGWRAG